MNLGISHYNSTVKVQLHSSKHSRCGYRMCDSSTYCKTDTSFISFCFACIICVCTLLVCHIINYATDVSARIGNVAEGKPGERSGDLPSATGSRTRGNGPEKKSRTKEQLQAA